MLSHKIGLSGIGHVFLVDAETFGLLLPFAVTALPVGTSQATSADPHIWDPLAKGVPPGSIRKGGWMFSARGGSSGYTAGKRSILAPTLAGQARTLFCLQRRF